MTARKSRDAARRGRWAVAAMFGVNGFVMGAWAPQIPLLLVRHQITESSLGLLILGLGLGAVGAMLFAGRLIAQHGSRRVVIALGVMVVPVLPLVVHAPTLPLLALAMAAMGALVGSMDVAMNANAVEVERRLGRAIMSSSHGFWSLGGFAGGALGGLVLARTSAEAQALAVAAIAALVLALAARFLITEMPSGVAANTDAAPGVKPGLLPRSASLWILGAMALFSMVPQSAVLDWAALYLNKEMGTSLALSGLPFAFFAGAMAVMRFSGDALRNRFGAVATLRLSGLVGAAGMMVAAIAPHEGVAIAGFALSGLGVANMVPILFSAAGNQPGLSAGAGIAAVTMVGYSGIVIAPSTIGFVAEAVGYRAIYGTLALLLVVVAALAGRAAAADGVARPA